MARVLTPPHDEHRPAFRGGCTRKHADRRFHAARLLALVIAAIALVGAFTPASARAQSSRPWLGVVLAPAATGTEGVPVSQVVRGSPAHRANLAAGDRITTVEDRTVRTPNEVIDAVKAMSPGQTVRVTFLRSGKKLQAQTTLVAMPTGEALLRMQHGGKRAPELVGTRPVTGLPSAASVASLRGRVVLVEFWSPYCVACRLSSPHLNAWARQYAARGLTVLGVGTDEPDAIASSAREWGLGYPLVADPAMETWKAWGIRDAPSMLLIDRRGVVRDVATGFDLVRFRELQGQIERLLLEPAP